MPPDAAVDGGSLRPDDADTLASSRYATRNRRFREESWLGASLAMAYRRPWRRLFQFDWNASARASRIRREQGERMDGYDAETGSARSDWHVVSEYPLLEADVDGSAAFYPDTRTEVKAGLGFGGWRKLDYLGSKRDLAAMLGYEPRQEAWWNRSDRRDELEDFSALPAGASPKEFDGRSSGVSALASLTYYLF